MVTGNASAADGGERRTVVNGGRWAAFRALGTSVAGMGTGAGAASVAALVTVRNAGASAGMGAGADAGAGAGTRVRAGGGGARVGGELYWRARHKYELGTGCRTGARVGSAGAGREVRGAERACGGRRGAGAVVGAGAGGGARCGNARVALCFVDFFRLFSQKLKISFLSLIKRHTVTYV